jgi:uncharacterized protein (TIGR01777 family)
VNRVVIAGGSGFLGRNLAGHLLSRGVEVVVLSRQAPPDDPEAAGGAPDALASPGSPGRWRQASWDGRSVGAWARHLDGAAAIVNLAGRAVDCRKTPDRCDEILRSRVEPTLAIGSALQQTGRPPRVWVQMSTAHIYGDPPEVVCDEESAFGYGLAPTVGKAWEQAFVKSIPPAVRPVILRTTFVLGRHGGALRKLARLARLGLGGKVGHGRQGISWIHEEDLNRLMGRAIADERMRGAYLATAPHPVSNAEFMRALRASLGIPFGLPAAEWMVRLAAPLFMDTDPELAIYGRYCVSRRLREEGFEFRFPDLASAFRELHGRSGTVTTGAPA